jgi:hemolysin III
MRTKLKERVLPAYSRGEEIFNMVTHIAGGAIGIGAVISCVIAAVLHENMWGVVSGSVYGGSIIVMYTMSSVYHGLTAVTAKKVFQILDHCTIFILISGTYTPILLGKFRELYPLDAWIIFALLWIVTVVGIVLNSIDLKTFKKASIACYLVMGWCIFFRLPNFLKSYPFPLFLLLLAGGISYTIGAVFYVMGRKKKFIHSIFHLFTDVATLLHLIGIVMYVM